MRYAPRAILAGGLGFAVSFVVACGGGAGLLSGDQSIALSGQGNEINSAVQSGNCGAAINASAALNNDVHNLPVTVNPTLRSNLNQGAVHDRAARREGLPPAPGHNDDVPAHDDRRPPRRRRRPTTTDDPDDHDDHDHDADARPAPPQPRRRTRVLLLRRQQRWRGTRRRHHDRRTGNGNSGGTGPADGNSGGNGGGG